MFHRRTAPALGLLAVLGLGSAPAMLAIDVPLHNWSAPSVYTPLRSEGSKSLMADAAPFGLPFVPVTPCRLVDTRAGQGFSGQAGPPSLAANSARSFTVLGTVPGIPTQCGIPNSAWAVSLNIAVINMTSNGNLVLYGGPTPPVSSAVNWTATSLVVSGSTVVGFPSSTITALFNGPAGAHVDAIIDVNGYYSALANTATSPMVWETINTGTGTSAIVGIAAGTTGRIYGVEGLCQSTGSPGSNDSAGVLGRDSAGSVVAGATNLISSAGVRGEGRTGVVGITEASISGSGGVTGLFLTGTTLNTIGSLAPSSTVAVSAIGNFTASGSKSFVEPHPTDASKMIDYVSLEGPEAGTYFRGTGQIVHGLAIIDVPEHFAMVTDPEGLTVQLTPIGASSNMFIEREGLDGIVVRASRDVKFHYLVQGVRSGFKDHQPIAENTAFVPGSPTDTMPSALSAQQKQRLVANGTYNPDGTPNKETARALGWAKVWEQKAQPAKSPSN